jgi:peptidoglycan/xylan/chitin deacetylase (PgdA/CDA1 family)
LRAGAGKVLPDMDIVSMDTPQSAGAKPARATPREVMVIVILAVDGLLVWLDNVTGPFLPFTVFYIALMYFAMTRVGAFWAYCVALLSAAGRTYAASSGYPAGAGLAFAAWQFATSFSVFVLICYLLDRRRYPRRTSLPADGAAPAPAATAGGVPASGRRRSSGWASGEMDRYVPALILASLGFLAAFVPWVRSAMTPDLYCLDQGSARITRNPISTMPTAVDAPAPRKTVLLTIDDAPKDPEIDGQLLDVLDRYSAKALWFVNCKGFDPAQNAGAARNLQVLLRIRESGHLIGNHGYNHLNLKVLERTDPAQMADEITRCTRAIRDATGIRPVYFRAPWGDFTPGVIRVANDDGMTIMRWNVSVDSLFGFSRAGATRAPAPAAVDKLADSVQSGDIVLLHDNPGTAVSFDAFLARLKQRGFDFVLPGRHFSKAAIEAAAARSPEAAE